MFSDTRGYGCDLVDKILTLDFGLRDLLDSEVLGRTPNLDFLFVKTRIKLFLSLHFIKLYNKCHCKVLAPVLGSHTAFNLLQSSIYSLKSLLSRCYWLEPHLSGDLLHCPEIRIIIKLCLKLISRSTVHVPWVECHEHVVNRWCFFLADIDECALPTGGHICSFRCINIPGSFQCTCPSTGYRLAPNARNCQGGFKNRRDTSLDCGILTTSSSFCI